MRPILLAPGRARELALTARPPTLYTCGHEALLRSPLPVLEQGAHRARREAPPLRAHRRRLQPRARLLAEAARGAGAEPEGAGADPRRRRPRGLRLDGDPRVSRGPPSRAAPLPEGPRRTRALPPGRGGVG